MRDSLKTRSIVKYTIPATLEHVVWDWNGTLLDDVAISVEAINILLARRQLPLLSLDAYRKIFGFPVQDCYRKLGFVFSTHAEWDALAREFHTEYNQRVPHARLSPGLPDVLDAFHRQGIRMSVLSASEESMLLQLLDSHGIRHRFQHICGHTDLYGNSKISTAHGLAQRLGIPPSLILMVGDTTHDFEVARAMDWHCVLYLQGHQDPERLTRCSCPSLDELPGLALFQS